jgi:hypothetical protein
MMAYTFNPFTSNLDFFKSEQELDPTLIPTDPRYFLLAGRPGGQIGAGGTSTSDSLTFQANAQPFASGNTGRIRFLERIKPLDADITFATNGTVNAIEFTGRTYTLSSTAAFIRGLSFENELRYTTQPAFGVTPPLLNFSSVIRAVGSMTLTSTPTFTSQPNFTADGGVWTMPNSIAPFFDNPSFSVANSGSFASTSSYPSIRLQCTVNTGVTLNERVGLLFTDAGGAGAIATQVGVDIQALTKGSTANISLRSVGASVQMQHAGPAVFGATGSPNANLMMDVNGGLAVRGTSITLANGTNTAVNVGNRSLVDVTGPTAAFTIAGIAGGVNGKLLIIVNRTTQNMTIAHESTSETTTANRINTSTAANVTTTGAGYVTLVYSAVASRWLLLASQL